MLVITSLGNQCFSLRSRLLRGSRCSSLPPQTYRSPCWPHVLLYEVAQLLRVKLCEAASHRKHVSNSWQYSSNFWGGTKPLLPKTMVKKQGLVIWRGTQFHISWLSWLFKIEATASTASICLPCKDTAAGQPRLSAMAGITCYNSFTSTGSSGHKQGLSDSSPKKNIWKNRKETQNLCKIQQY